MSFFTSLLPNNSSDDINAVRVRPANPQDLQLTLVPSFNFPEAIAHEKQDTMFMASLKAPKYESDSSASRAPLDIICVIDKSGSMSGEKIALVKNSLAFMVEQLKPNDRMAIVGFDSNVYNDLKLTALNDEGKKHAKSVISKLSPGSSTNLSGGLFEGFNVVKKRSAPKSEVCSILLFTDGLANVGLSKAAQIVPEMEKQFQKIGSACTVFTFGFGSDHDANMLRAISDAGNGLYYYIQKEDEIPEAFANCLGGLTSVVAQNIKLVVEPTKGVKILKILSSYKYQTVNEKLEIQIGDLYSEEGRDFIVQIECPALQEPNEQYVPLKLSLSYFDVVSTSLKTMEVDAVLKRMTTLSPNLQCNVKLDIQRNRILAADALDAARKAGDSGNLEEARKIVNSTIDLITKSASAEDKFCSGLVEDLEECLSNLTTVDDYQNVGNKMLNCYGDANKKQRCAQLKSKAQVSYASESKKSMVAKFSKK